MVQCKTTADSEVFFLYVTLVLSPFCRLWEGFVRGERTERLDHSRNVIQPTIEDRTATVSLVSTLRTKSWSRGSWTFKSNRKKEKRTERLNTRLHHPKRRVFNLSVHCANLFWLKKDAAFPKYEPKVVQLSFCFWITHQYLADARGLQCQSSFVYNY